MYEELLYLVGIPLSFTLFIIFLLTGLIGIILCIIKSKSKTAGNTPIYKGLSEVPGFTTYLIIGIVGLLLGALYFILEFAMNPLRRLNPKVLINNYAINCKRDDEPFPCGSLSSNECSKNEKCQFLMNILIYFQFI